MSRVSKAWEALQDLSQRGIETVTRSARVDIVGGGIDEIDPPEEIDQYAEWAKNTAIIRANLRKFVNDVWEPGYRVEGPDTTVQYFEGEQEDLEGSAPEDTPTNGFLSQAAIYAGERNQEFYNFGKETTWQRWVRGTVLHELIKLNPDDPESEITGFHFIRPETVYPRVLNNTNILLPPEQDQLPEDINTSDVETTKRGEVAAYVQFDDESILGLRNNGFDQQDIPLSQNDVLKQTLEPDIGGDIGTAEGVFGTSVLSAIDDDITEYKQIKRDRAEAISRKAYGVWTAQFTPEILEVTQDQNEIIRWDDDSIQDTEAELNNMGPGDVLTTDASLDLKKHESDVPDLGGTLDHYVDEILSALPAPKALTGFSDDINRDVVGDQRESYEDMVSEERQYQENYWTRAIRVVAERKGLETEGLKLKIEPEKEENPVKSLDDDAINRMNTYVSTLSAAAGPTVGPTALVSREAILEILDFPEVEGEEAQDIADEMAEMGDEEAAQAWADIMGVEALETRYSEGDEVNTPDGQGIVVDAITESFEESEGEQIEASSDSPAYAVILADEDKEIGFYKATDIEESEIETDVDNPEQDLEALLDIAQAQAGNYESLQDGFFEWPQSWVDSPQPARLIALKAFAGMNGSFDGCEREMRGNIAAPERFCADFIDRLVGNPYWRGDSWAPGD